MFYSNLVRSAFEIHYGERLNGFHHSLLSNSETFSTNLALICQQPAMNPFRLLFQHPATALSQSVQRNFMKFCVYHTLMPRSIAANVFVKSMNDYRSNGMMHERRYIPRPSLQCQSSVPSAVLWPSPSFTKNEFPAPALTFHHNSLAFINLRNL